MIRRTAPAKVNLYLHVTGRRADGYHLLDSLVAFVQDAADSIILTPAEKFSLTVSGPFAKNLPADPAENLTVKAARGFCTVTGFDPESFSLHIEKNLPLGAGLGGGSSDAAQTVHLLEEFSGRTLEHTQREELLLSLGADVPVCYRACASRMSGVGEILVEAPPLPAMPILLIWPGAHSETKAVFSAREKTYTAQSVNMPPAFSGDSALIEFLERTDNDLRDAAISLTPVIADAEEFMRMQTGCRLARMSGSGASVFGLFDTIESCRASQDKARSINGWWAQAGTL